MPAALAQVAINGSGADSDPSAMLDVTSNNSGVLIPRLTLAQRNAIPSPATGLMIYCTSDNLFHFYNGSQWTIIEASSGGGTNWTNIPTTDNIRNSTGGYVGIGPYNPEARLQVSSINTGETEGIRLRHTTDDSYLYHNSTGDMVMRKSDQANQLVLDDGGNVGIGTDAPSTPLDVHTDLSSGGVTITTDDVSFISPATGHIWHNSDQDLLISSGNLNDRDLVLDANGRIGINTDLPARTLEVVSANNDGANNGIRITEAPSFHSGSFYMNGNQLVIQPGNEVNTLVLDPNIDGPGGRVGINTPTPGESLDVNGTAVIRDNLDVKGFFDVDDSADIMTNLTVGQDLNVGNQVKISGGSPALGKVLTATDANGNASWQSLPSLAGINSATAWQSGESNSGTGSGVQSVGPKGVLNNVVAGDMILVMASFRCRLNSGSGNDDFQFRFRFEDGSNAFITHSTTSGNITMIDEHRGEWIPVSINQVTTIGQSGTIKFMVGVGRDSADDPLYLSNIRVTAIVLK